MTLCDLYNAYKGVLLCNFVSQVYSALFVQLRKIIYYVFPFYSSVVILSFSLFKNTLFF